MQCMLKYLQINSGTVVIFQSVRCHLVSCNKFFDDKKLSSHFQWYENLLSRNNL